MRRVKITLDAARGLAYMYEEANPSILHRDIQSTNILLDDQWNAKVADFGISKPVRDTAKEYITTPVKGTMGYMDHEYHSTEQLTKKSDLYGLGIMKLELLTARAPIQHNKHIAREVMKSLGNIHDILDCVEDTGAERPTMSKDVRELDNIMQLAIPGLDTEFYWSSSGLERSVNQDLYHPYDNDGYDRIFRD
ncbi:hypothetical protein ACET3Z_001684 [Daucus carota]